jgi:sarcosine oxidase subunit beta
MIMWGYIKRASELGVRLCQGVLARGIEARHGQVEGVHTDDGFVSTRVVVNAGGPWAIEIGKWIGVQMPIINLARSIWVTKPFPDIPSSRPFVEDVTAEWYYRPDGSAILMGMGAVPTDLLDIQISQTLTNEMIDAAIHRVPVLEKASVLTSWTGIRPVTLDDHPILGPVPSVRGFVLNCGWGGTGIIQAPIAGQLIAEYIANGHMETVDANSLGIERFQGKSAHEVMNLWERSHPPATKDS